MGKAEGAYAQGDTSWGDGKLSTCIPEIFKWSPFEADIVKHRPSLPLNLCKSVHNSANREGRIMIFFFQNILVPLQCHGILENKYIGVSIKWRAEWEINNMF